MPPPELTFDQRFEYACQGIQAAHIGKIKEQMQRIEELEESNHALQTMLRRTYNGRLPTCIQLLRETKR